VCLRCVHPPSTALSFVVHGDGTVTYGAGIVAINGSLGAFTATGNPTVNAPWSIQNSPSAQYTSCKNDKATFLTNTFARPCDRTMLADVGNAVIVPGVNCAATMSAAASTYIYFDASGVSEAIFYVVISGSVVIGASVVMVLRNGALPRNIYLVTTGDIGFGASAVVFGNMVTKGAIVFGASVVVGQSRLLPQGAMTLGASNNLYLPAGIACLCQ
jgi:hypothetical protein